MSIDDHRDRINDLEADVSGNGTSARFFEPASGGIWVHVEIENGAHQLQYEAGSDPDGWEGELQAAVEQLRNERDS